MSGHNNSNNPSSVSQDDASLVEHQLGKILAASHFKSAKQMQNFLRYIVRKTLAGKTDSLKQYTIAVEGLNFPTDFDSDINPVVRIIAGRVRERLTKYYEEEGCNDPLVISLPKGGYTPDFKKKPRAQLTAKSGRTNLSLAPKLAVICFTDETQNKESNRLLFQISDILVNELSQFLFVRLAVSIPHADKTDTRFATSEIRERFQADFMLVFYVQQQPKQQFTLLSRLLNTETKEIIWSDTYKVNFDVPFSEQHEIIGAITAVVADMQQGALYHHWARKLLEDEATIPKHFQSVAYYRYYNDDFGLDAFKKVVTMCEERLAENPNDTISNVLYAEYCRRDYAYGYNYIEDALEKGKQCAQNAIRKAPGSPEAHYGLAQVLFCLQEWPRCVDELNIARDISQYHASIEYGVGFHFCLMGQWKEGLAIINKITSYSASYPSWYNLPLFLDAYLNKNYKDALAFAQKIDTPTVFHGALSRCVSYAQLGEKNKTKKELEDLLAIYPSFMDTGVQFLTRFLGSEEIVDKVWQGILKAQKA